MLRFLWTPVILFLFRAARRFHLIGAATIGALIALAMLLPPLIHIVTGPLGPFVGGFFAGYKARVSVIGAFGVGLFMSMVFIAPIFAVIHFATDMDQVFQKLLVAAVVMYTGFMGFIGATIGGYSSRRKMKMVRIDVDLEMRASKSRGKF
jgi:hypothetical protein